MNNVLYNKYDMNYIKYGSFDKLVYYLSSLFAVRER